MLVAACLDDPSNSKRPRPLHGGKGVGGGVLNPGQLDIQEASSARDCVCIKRALDDPGERVNMFPSCHDDAFGPTTIVMLRPSRVGIVSTTPRSLMSAAKRSCLQGFGYTVGRPTVRNMSFGRAMFGFDTAAGPSTPRLQHAQLVCEKRVDMARRITRIINEDRRTHRGSGFQRRLMRYRAGAS
jgi:hypothetical protein